MLNEQEKEMLRGLLVSVGLDLRRHYLANGGKPLTHWDRLHGRLRAAAMTTATVEEWLTRYASGLQIPAPSKEASLGSFELVKFVTDRRATNAFFAMLERE